MIDHSTRSREDTVSLSSSYSLYHRRRFSSPSLTCPLTQQSHNGAIFSERRGDEMCTSRRKTKRNMLNTHIHTSFRCESIYGYIYRTGKKCMKGKKIKKNLCERLKLLFLEYHQFNDQKLVLAQPQYLNK